MEKENQHMREVRQSTMADLPAFRRAQANAWLEAYPSPENGVSFEWVKDHVEQWQTKERMEESEKLFASVLADSSQFHNVAVLDGEVVGFIHGSTKEDGSKELEGLYTDPEVYGKGTGADLMRAFDRWAREQSVILSVISYNQRAIRFYEKHGFTIIEGSNGFHRDIMPTIEMKREANYTNEEGI